MAEPILKRFLTGMLATGIGSASVVLLGMFGLMLSARLLTTDELGAFFLLQVLVLFAAEGSSFGIHLALERWLPGMDAPQERRLTLNTALLFRLLTVAVGVLVLALVMPSVLARLALAPTPTLIALLLAWFILEAVLKLVLTYLQTQFAFNAIGTANALSSLVNFASILGFVLVLETGLMGLLYAKLASRVLALGYAWWARPLPLGLLFDAVLLRRMLRYALPLYANYFLAFLSVRADTLLIGGMLGTTAVAYYEVARRIPDSLMQLYDAFRQVYFPFVVRGIADDALGQVSTLLNNSTRFGAFALGLACLIAFVFADEIIVLLFSETYLPSATTFTLLMVVASLLMIETTLGSTLAALGDSDKPLLINIVRTGLQLTAYFFWIPPLGIAGAALAALVAAAAVLPINVYFLRRRALAVDSFAFGKPMLIAGLIAAALTMSSTLPPAFQVLLILAYLPVAVIGSVVRRHELAAAFGLLSRRLAPHRGRKQLTSETQLAEPFATTTDMTEPAPLQRTGEP